MNDTLQNAIIDRQFGPDQLGAHQSLEFLGLIPRTRRIYGYPVVAYRLGAGPSSTVSGLLAQWVVQALGAMPRLLRLAHDLSILWDYTHWKTSDPPWWHDHEFGMMIRSYTDGIDTLYHARYTGGEANTEEYLLGPHHTSYTSLDMEWADFSSDCTGWRRERTVVDLTFYQGYPVPFALLDRVYRLNGDELEWRDPGRDMTLVPEAWALLRGWLGEVEKDRDERGDDDMQAPLTEPDIGRRLLFHRPDPKRINAITPSRHFSSSGRVCVCVCIAVWAEFSALHRTCRSESPDTMSKLIPTTMAGRSDRARLLDNKGRAKTYGSTSADLSHRDRRSSDSSVDLEEGSDGSLTPVNDTSRAGSVKEDERPPRKFREIWVLCLGLFSA